MIYLWKSADIQGIQEDPNEFSTHFDETNLVSLDTMCKSLKNKIHSIMAGKVHTKMKQARYTHPWMNRKIRLLIRWKQWAYRKAQRTEKKRDNDRNKRLQSEVQLQIRKSHTGYMQEVVSDSYKGNPKKF